MKHNDTPLDYLFGNKTCAFCQESIKIEHYSHGRDEERKVYNCSRSAYKTSAYHSCTYREALICPKSYLETLEQQKERIRIINTK